MCRSAEAEMEFHVSEDFNEMNFFQDLPGFSELAVRDYLQLGCRVVFIIVRTGVSAAAHRWDRWVGTCSCAGLCLEAWCRCSAHFCWQLLWTGHSAEA